MGVIDYTVYCQTKRRCLFPWKITSVGNPSCTFKEFFDTNIKPACTASSSSSSADPPQIILNEVYIGRAKDSLDLVDFDLIIEEVVPAFGRFVKFAVGHKEVSF